VTWPTGKDFPKRCRARASIRRSLRSYFVTATRAIRSTESTGTWRGIANKKARSETVRKAQPIMADDLRKLINTLKPDRAGEVRDASH
jgi:hypothetical protein